VLITKDSESCTDIAVPAVVDEDLPGVLCGYHLAHIRPRESLHGPFLNRAFAAIGPRDQFQVAANGITRYGLGSDAIRTGLFPIPPPEEQFAITAFLDRETDRIDALVAKKVRLIELLQEKRTALITRAVTKGLDPTVPTKDSGVEWLGDIPAPWEIRQGRYLYKPLDLAPQEADGVVTAYRDGEVTLRENRRTEGYTFAVQEVGYQRVRAGDLVIQGMDAFAGAIGVSDSTGKCSPEYLVLEPILPGTENRYFAAALRLMAKRGYILVVCNAVRERAPRFRFREFRTVLLPEPSAREQRAIADVLDQEIAEIDSLVAKIREAIHRLQEFRTALISAAVTGKIDVREDAA
jgi:type I restriction enzyme S subunit